MQKHEHVTDIKYCRRPLLWKYPYHFKKRFEYLKYTNLDAIFKVTEW